MLKDIKEHNQNNSITIDKNLEYVLSDSCVSCATCESECPVSAISQGDSQYVIDADACISCGTCAGVCPTGAINEG